MVDCCEPGNEPSVSISARNFVNGCANVDLTKIPAPGSQWFLSFEIIISMNVAKYLTTKKIFKSANVTFTSSTACATIHAEYHGYVYAMLFLFTYSLVQNLNVNVARRE